MTAPVTKKPDDESLIITTTLAVITAPISLRALFRSYKLHFVEDDHNSKIEVSVKKGFKNRLPYCPLLSSQ